MLRFTTNAYPKEQRWDAWRFALQRKSLQLQAMDAENVYGELSELVTERHIEILSLISTPQSLILDRRDQSDGLWLLVLLVGEAQAHFNGQLQALNEGDLLLGDINTPVRLDFLKDNRFLLLNIPKPLLNLKIRAPLPDTATVIASTSGAARILSGMLRSVADTLNEVTPDQLRPVELSLPEFLITTLMESAPAKSLGGSAGARAMLLERVFQTIEMHLSDPELSLQKVAHEHGISMRYLQKLFETVDESFGHYIKRQRLERCRMDLLSPLHAQKSISDILFQWGFNDSASFSRAFREQYGMSPREYRKSPPQDTEGDLMPMRGRPALSKTRREAEAEGPAEAVVLFDDAAFDAAVEAEAPPVNSAVRHHYLPVSPETVHWGYFSRQTKPVLTIRSGDYVTIETLTHHAADDWERMIEGDEGAESVYRWTKDAKAIDRRGAGPMDASSVGRGAGEGFGVHICTGPIAVTDAKPGDIIQVRFLEMHTRPSQNPKFAGRSFGSNVAAYWGFHYNDMLTEPKPREMVTVYEIENHQGRCCAHAVYNFRYTPQTDPFGVRHERYDYPGVPIDHATVKKNYDVLRSVEIPVRPHFGLVALAPAQGDLVDSVPPANFGGNMDNWRLGAGASVFLPVGVAGGLLTLGDPHASQGDSELCGTAIECSMTALVQVILHKRETLTDPLRDIDYPLIETTDEWVIMGFSQPNYLRELGEKAQSEIYKKASIEDAMRDAFRKSRRFLMTSRGMSEDEAISLLSVGVDFGITQVVNGNWGAHAIIRKGLFTS
ncbi:MAG: acetamidase/formamidase family protein [Asticcacaulis sp.]